MGRDANICGVLTVAGDSRKAELRLESAECDMTGGRWWLMLMLI